MSSESRWLSGVILITAGAYQLSALKNVCLAHCRTPTAFLSRHWRHPPLRRYPPGRNARRVCVGCCWMLVALLFVGGVMNLAWIAALAFLVLIEKAMPSGHWIGQGIGIALIGWGVATLT